MILSALRKSSGKIHTSMVKIAPRFASWQLPASYDKTPT
jgi:hypothetical protein